MQNKNSKNFSIKKQYKNKILIYGKHPFFSVLKFGKREIYEVYVYNKNKNEFLSFVKENNINISDKNLNYVESDKLNSFLLNKELNHQGYILFAGEKQNKTFNDFINETKKKKCLPKLLILDQIVDPHNLGAIIRTAVAFGIYDIIITSFNSVKDTSVVSKTSAGLSEVVNLIDVVNLNYTIKDLKDNGYFIIGLDGEAKSSINDLKEHNNIALVLGNEGKGIRELVKKNCDTLVKIEMENCVESLNVSVASAIAIYELLRY